MENNIEELAEQYLRSLPYHPYSVAPRTYLKKGFIAGYTAKSTPQPVSREGDEPLPEGIYCRCENCRGGFFYDLVVPDTLWAGIAPKPVEGYKGGGLLCPECIMKKTIEFYTTTLGKYLIDCPNVLDYIEDIRKAYVAGVHDYANDEVDSEMYVEQFKNKVVPANIDNPVKTKEEILEYYYESFIGTRHTCEKWFPFNHKEMEEVKECVYAAMEDYKNQ